MNRRVLREAISHQARSHRLSAPLFRRLRTEQLIRNGPSSEYFWLYKLAIEGTRALDIGANVGQTSSVLAKRIGAQGEVLALEPNPMCIREMRLFSRSPIFPIQVAAGSQFGSAILNVPIGPKKVPQAQLGSLVVRGDISDITYDHVTVPMIPLDSLLAWTPLTTSIIKIDVEGYESQVIDGLRQTLLEQKPAIVFEVEEQHQPVDQGVDDVFRKIAGFGYKIFCIGESGAFPLAEFNLDIHQRAHLKQPGQNFYVNNFIAIHQSDEIRLDQISSNLSCVSKKDGQRNERIFQETTSDTI
jgi:FkbM family methyltransferase